MDDVVPLRGGPTRPAPEPLWREAVSAQLRAERREPVMT
jgi:hypothetical protein